MIFLIFSFCPLCKEIRGQPKVRWLFGTNLGKSETGTLATESISDDGLFYLGERIVEFHNCISLRNCRIGIKYGKVSISYFHLSATNGVQLLR